MKCLLWKWIWHIEADAQEPIRLPLFPDTRQGSKLLPLGCSFDRILFDGFLLYLGKLFRLEERRGFNLGHQTALDVFFNVAAGGEAILHRSGQRLVKGQGTLKFRLEKNKRKYKKKMNFIQGVGVNNVVTF